jgi:integrase
MPPSTPVSIVETLDTSTVAGLRDKALLLLGFSAALRRSEIVNLDVEDLSFRSDGFLLRIRRGKTDQEGRGRTIGVAHGRNGTCPVVAVRRWLMAAGIESGPLFRAVDRHDHIRQGRLCGRTVCRIVKRHVPQAGLDPARFGGHSLRSGFATSAAAAGVEEREIAEVTGHRSLVVLRGYIRSGKLFDVERIGL